MRDSSSVRLEVATPDMTPVLANLLELYVHDMSEIFGLEVGADGRFGYEWLSRYWSEPEDRFPFLIHSGERLAGFALAMRGSPGSDDPEAFDVAEFFVLRRHRRTGVGRNAAFLLWNRLPGRWVVRVSEANRGGLPFWRRTAREYAGDAVSEKRLPGEPHDWHAFVFESVGARATDGTNE